MTDATESASSAFMPEGGLFSSDNLAQKNTVCNVYLRPGKIPTRIGRSHIDFEAEVGAFDACCLTQQQGLESMRYWFWKKLKEFTSSHELETNDGWIKFSALPPVE